MIKVGLTGGIGSGKSTVARIFEVLRVPVYYADTAAKRLMVENTPVRQALTEAFGQGVYNADGELQRQYLADKVFNDQAALDTLNSIVHPAVAEDSEKWLAQHEQYPYVIKEAALLYEAESYKQLDVMLCVVAPEEIRLQRVMQRDGVTAAAVRARMEKQWPQEKKAALADHVIINDDQQAIIPQVMALHRQFMTSAGAL